MSLILAIRNGGLRVPASGFRTTEAGDPDVLIHSRPASLMADLVGSSSDA